MTIKQIIRETDIQKECKERYGDRWFKEQMKITDWRNKQLSKYMKQYWKEKKEKLKA